MHEDMNSSFSNIRNISFAIVSNMLFLKIMIDVGESEQCGLLVKIHGTAVGNRGARKEEEGKS